MFSNDESFSEIYKHIEAAEYAILKDDYDLAITEFNLAQSAAQLLELQQRSFFSSEPNWALIDVREQILSNLDECYKQKVRIIMNGVTANSNPDAIATARLKIDKIVGNFRVSAPIPPEILLQRNTLDWHKLHLDNEWKPQTIALLLVNDALLKKSIALDTTCNLSDADAVNLTCKIVDALYANENKFIGNPFPLQLIDRIEHMIINNLKKSTSGYFFTTSYISFNNVDNLANAIFKMLNEYKAHCLACTYTP